MYIILALCGLIVFVGLVNFVVNTPTPRRCPYTLKLNNGQDFVVKKGLEGPPIVDKEILAGRKLWFRPVKDFTVICFDTANAYPDSVCAVGYAVVKNNKIVENMFYLCRPPYDDFYNTKYNGVTLASVERRPTFLGIWEQIRPVIEGQVVGAYNLPFHFSCLNAALKNIGAEAHYACFDILDDARRFLPGLKDYSLAAVSKIGNFDSSPDAGTRALNAARIQIIINKRIKAVPYYVEENSKIGGVLDEEKLA